MLSIGYPKRTGVGSPGRRRGEGSGFSLEVLVLMLGGEKRKGGLLHARQDYRWLGSCCLGTRFSMPCMASNLLAQPFLPPTPSEVFTLALK